ncbi:hypothetical protein ABPG75_005965 [Micractinium tetrahymenae]
MHPFDEQDEEVDLSGPWHFRVSLPLMWQRCRQLEVDAEHLLLGERPADDLAARHHEGGELVTVCQMLRGALNGTLQRLLIHRDALFILPSGTYMPATDLLAPEAAVHVQDCGLALSECGSDARWDDPALRGNPLFGEQFAAERQARIAISAAAEQPG